MMKKVFNSVIIALVALVTFSSCNKKDYLTVIPANATFVASADLASIGEKSDFNNSSVANLMNQYMGAVISEDGQKKVKQYMESPEDMGIDFSQPVYIFKTGNQCVGMTMKMGDKGDFEDFLDMLQKQNLASKPVERDDVMTGTLLDDIDYGYDGKTILLIASLGEGGSATGKQTLAALFAQKKDDSFVKTESYESLSNLKDKDVTIFSNMAALPDSMALEIKSLLPNGVRFTDVQLLASANFDNGKAVLTAQIEGTNDQAKKMLEEGNKNFHKIEGRYTNMPTNDFFAWGCMGVNGQWLLEKMKQDPEMKQRLFLVERGIDIEAMIKSIDGDMAVTLPASFFTSPDAKTTDFMACGKLKDSKFLGDVDYWKQGMKDYGITMQSTGKNEYLLTADEFKMNWGVNGDDLYIASQNAFNAMATAQKSDVLNQRKSDINECQVYFYVNLKSLPMNELAMVAGVPFVKNALSKLNALVFKMKSTNEMELSIELTDDKENFLKEIL